MASLELRREGLPADGGGIALGDAARQLSLDATPEELLAEIQARRSASRTRTTGRIGLRKRLAYLGILASLCLNILLAVQNRYFSNAIHASITSRQVDNTLTLSDAILSGVPVYVSLDDVRRIAKEPDSVMRDPHTYSHDWTDSAPWQIVPLEDGLYVRGWKPADPTFVVNSRVVENNGRIFTSQRVDSNSAPLTVPISAFSGIRDPDFVWKGATVDGIAYMDRHSEGVALAQEAMAGKHRAP